MRRTTRPEDMSPRGRMTLIRGDDGDVGILLVEDDGTSADVEFCASGGHSPWTLQALYALQEAMEKDERREPWPAPEPGVSCTVCGKWEILPFDTRDSTLFCWGHDQNEDET